MKEESTESKEEIKNEVIKKNNKLIFIMPILIILISILTAWSYIDKNKNKENSNDNSNIEENKKEQITPLMYEITKDGSDNKIYLFGSMHMVNLEEFDFPKYITEAYNSSKYLACEFDTIAYKEKMDVAKEIDMFLYKDGSTVKKHMSEENYNKMIEFLKEKYFYNETLDYYNLFFFESLVTQVILQNSELSNGIAVDEYFLNKAKEDNKTILEIESYEEQYNIIGNFPDRFYEMSIMESIDNYDEQIKSLSELYNSWKYGDAEKIIDESVVSEEDNYTEEEIKLIEDYNKALLDDRNINMADKLEIYFNSNYDTFYMVGVAHLVGDKGIANILEQRGYNVKRITN